MPELTPRGPGVGRDQTDAVLCLGPPQRQPALPGPGLHADLRHDGRPGQGSGGPNERALGVEVWANDPLAHQVDDPGTNGLLNDRPHSSAVRCPQTARARLRVHGIVMGLRGPRGYQNSEKFRFLPATS
jgi:hypothetical protein